MAEPYATVDDLQTLLTDTDWTQAGKYDTIMNSLLLRASRAIDRYTGRSPEAYAAPSVTMYFDGSGAREQWVAEIVGTPTVSMNTVGSFTASDYLALAATDFIPWPYNAAAEGEPYQRLDLDIYRGGYVFWYPARRSVKVVANFGYSLTPPEAITQATLTQAVLWFKRAQQGYQRVSGSATAGGDVYTGQLDPDVCLTIEHYKRYAV